MQLIRQILPPPGVVRALTARSVVYAVGAGVFQAGSALFFTQVLGLSTTQVGIGLSVAGAVAVVGSVPLGAIVDRFGARRTWIAAGLVEAAMFAAYPLVGRFPAFLALISVLALADVTTSTAKHVYTLQAIPAEDRVRALAYQRSALNVGFTAGAALSSIAVAVGTRSAYNVVVWMNAAMLLATAVLIVRMPRVASVAPTVTGRRFGALADRPFLALSGISGVLQAHNTLFAVVLPLWMVTMTDAPKILLPVLYTVNTVMAVTLQVRASRGSETPFGAGLALRRAGVAVAFAALLLAAAGLTSGVPTIVVLVAGTVLLTVGELTQSAGAWGITATLTPEDRRGEYTGTFKLGGQVQQALAPVGLTVLAVSTHGWGWLAIAALMLGAGAYAPRIVARVALAYAARQVSSGAQPLPVAVR